jgi:TolB-like protein/Flp pilus assembly protein TadD
MGDELGRHANGVSPELLHDALRRLLESRFFARAPRLSRLLRYLGEHALAGGPPLKEYDVARGAFDKSGEFNPAADPIVRVEAGRLRERLRRYYRAEGRSDPVRVFLPKGSYQLYLERRAAPAQTGPQPARAGGRAKTCRIVILPFADLSPNHQYPYLVEGLVDDLITILARSPWLRVLARRSSRRYATQPVNLRRVARQLGADFVLEGSLRPLGAQVRVCARVAESSTGTYFWSETFNFAEDDLACMPDVIGEAVVAALARHRDRGRKVRAATTRRAEAETYLLTLKGRYHVRRRNHTDLLRGVEYLDDALARDPDAVPALAALSEACTMLAWYGFLPSSEVMPKAAHCARRAVALDPHSPHAHLALGLVQELYDWDFTAAEREFQTACELDPADATAWFELALCLARTGRIAAGLERMRRAVQLEPLSATVRTNLGVLFYYQRRWQQAIRSFLEALEFNEHYFPAHFRLGAAYLQLGKFEAAVASLRQAMTLCEQCPTVMGLLGHALARMGNKAEAFQLAERLRSPGALCYARPTAMTLVYLGLGDKASALSMLRRALEERDPHVVDLAVDPIFDSLRKERIFRDLLSNLHLTARG